MEHLDIPSLEPLLEQSQPLSGSEFRNILLKIANLLIEVNAHLESGNRSYNSIFDRVMGINFTTTVYKQYDKLVSHKTYNPKLPQRPCESLWPFALSRTFSVFEQKPLSTKSFKLDHVKVSTMQQLECAASNFGRLYFRSQRS